ELTGIMTGFIHVTGTNQMTQTTAGSFSEGKIIFCFHFNVSQFICGWVHQVFVSEAQLINYRWELVLFAKHQNLIM
ncbi:hypothetical protein QNZ44_004200, partial [Enterobacter kobei]